MINIRIIVKGGFNGDGGDADIEDEPDSEDEMLLAGNIYLKIRLNWTNIFQETKNNNITMFIYSKDPR